MGTLIEAPFVGAKPMDDDLLTKQELAAKLKKTPRCIELWMR